jgi:hypothetical protein
MMIGTSSAMSLSWSRIRQLLVSEKQWNVAEWKVRARAPLNSRDDKLPPRIIDKTCEA